MAGLSEGQLAEVSEEGLGSKGAVVPMMMMVVVMMMMMMMMMKQKKSSISDNKQTSC